MGKRKLRSPKFLIATVIVSVAVFAMLAVLVSREFLSPSEKVLSAEEVLVRLSKFSEIKSIAYSSADVKYISSEQLSRLSKEQPVIYSDIKNPVYSVEYRLGDQGIFVLYDAKADKVAKQFQIQYVTVG